VKRSETLGISQNLGSALKERHRANQRAGAYLRFVAFCSSYGAAHFLYFYPGLRFAPPWAEFFYAFGV
jgi:hypothetical protein